MVWRVCLEVMVRLYGGCGECLEGVGETLDVMQRLSGGVRDGCPSDVGRLSGWCGEAI